MKNKVMLLLGIILTGCAIEVQSQWIQSLTVIPSNPTPNDTITILANCDFSSAGCSDHTQTLSVVGNHVYASALHCLGVLTMICNYTDTFKIAPLPSGSYTFHFQVDAGQGPAPCTPGFVPGPNDSVLFVVSPAVGLSEYIYQDAVQLFPNPAGEEFSMGGFDKENYPVTLEIFTQEGKLVKKSTAYDANTVVNITELPSAIYQVRITPNNGDRLIIPLIKK